MGQHVDGGQGAMEYLMSYGWAVLVVMVVGVTIWQLGAFNIGGSMPTTSSGFTTLKPLPQTCEMMEGAMYCREFPAWEPRCNTGFTCQFVNAAAGEILIRSVDVRINNQYCWWHMAASAPKFDPNDPTVTQQSSCANEDVCPVWGQCMAVPVGGTNRHGYSCVNDPTNPGLQAMLVPKDAQFTVAEVATDGGNPAWQIGPCGQSEFKPGQQYNVEVDIEYLIEIGGQWVTKHSTGTVKLVST